MLVYQLDENKKLKNFKSILKIRLKFRKKKLEYPATLSLKISPNVKMYLFVL